MRPQRLARLAGLSTVLLLPLLLGAGAAPSPTDHVLAFSELIAIDVDQGRATCAAQVTLKLQPGQPLGNDYPLSFWLVNVKVAPVAYDALSGHACPAEDLARFAEFNTASTYQWLGPNEGETPRVWGSGGNCAADYGRGLLDDLGLLPASHISCGMLEPDPSAFGEMLLVVGEPYRLSFYLQDTVTGWSFAIRAPVHLTDVA